MTAGIEFDPAEREAIAAEMNISVLKRSDTAIKCVLKSANHVCLYHLEDNHQWRRLEVEGSLFIVERHLDHRNNPNRRMHRIVIINRKSLNNYTDDIIVGNKHLELNNQMIMYSNSKRATIGIWFYQKAQADDIFHLLQSIVSGQNPHPTPETSRPNRTPKRPAKPAEQSPINNPVETETPAESAPDNSLERFFPNLKLTNGVAGHQVPDAAKESMFESHAVSAMSKSPEVPLPMPATAFKPTAEIDAAIITASESGIPEGVVPRSTTTDVNTLASQAIQLVKGKPKPDQKRKLVARPRHSPNPAPPHSLSQGPSSYSPPRANGAAKTTSPPRSSPPPKLNQPPKTSPPAKSAASAKSNTTIKQPRQPVRASPPAKRAPGGKRGQSAKASISGKYQATDKPVATVIPVSAISTNPAEKADPNATALPNPQIQFLTKPKPVVAESKPSGTNGQPAGIRLGQETVVPAAPPLAIPGTASRGVSIVNQNDPKRRPPVSSAQSARPITPNVPISKEIPGAPRARQAKTLTGGAHALHASNSTVPPLGDDEKAAIRQRGMSMPRAEEEARRQLHSISMRQAHAENLKMQEAHMFGVQPPFPFGSAELGMGQPPSMMGGALSGPGALPGPGAGGTGFTPSLHPQMAMMMQQQQHQMFMQQQYMAQQHQRQMQMQAGHAHAMAEASGSGVAGEVTGSGSQTGRAKTKEESANDLMRMLNVNRSESTREIHKIDEKKSAEGVGGSIAEVEKRGEIGTSGGKLDKVSFRAVVQRMLTDRRFFESVYGHYLSSG